MPSEKVYTVEALERERQAKLKEAVAGEPNFQDEDDEEYSDELLKQIASFQTTDDPNGPPTCKSYAAAEALIIKAMKKGAKMADVRLDLTNQQLSVVPADVLRLGESLVQLSVVGNMIVELPADLDLCKRLRVLNLAANELAGLPKLVGLKGLIHVGLGYNRVTDHGLQALHRCLPAGLQSLDLTANELTNLENLLEAFEEKFHSLRHLSLMSNPLAISGSYRSTVAKSALGSHLSQLDGTELSADSLAPPPAAVGGAEGEGEEEEEEEVVDDGKPKVTLKVTIMQLSGVPEVAEAPAAEEGAEAADPPPEPVEQQLVVDFTIGGKSTTTKALARAPVVDFDNSSVELTLPLGVALRDELIVHGIPFAVYTLTPVPPAEDAEEGAEPPEPERALLGVVTTHWGPLAQGTAELTQVCQSLITPPPPKKEKGSKKKASKPSPPFTLAVTASIQIVEKEPQPF